MDWPRARLSGLALAAMPYLLGVGLCAWYALQAPAIFAAQRHAELYRTVTLPEMLRNMGNDVHQRYLFYYFSNLAGTNKLKVFCLIFAAAGVIGLLFLRSPALRQTRRVLLIFSAIVYVAVAVIDDMKFPLYFIYCMPVFAACGAVWVYELWVKRGRARWLACPLLALSIAASTGGFGYKIYKDDYRTQYLPAVAEIKSDLHPGDIVMAGSELGFALGFGPPLVDDRYLGYFSGIRPQVYVMNEYYLPMLTPNLERAWAWSRQILQKDYRLAYQNALYKVYVQKD